MSGHGTQPLIIVIGRGHSGTRAISRTLRESGVFMGATLNASYDLVPATEMYEACRVFGRHVIHRGGLEWDFTKAISSPVDPEFEQLVRSYASSVLRHNRGIRGWKLPETTLVFPWIVRMFPNAYYISWVRDPRDSIIGRHLTDDLADFGVPYDRVDDEREMRAISWKYQRSIVAATVKPDRWIEIRFEDFVIDQAATLERLEAFLGIRMAVVPVRPESLGRFRTDDGRNSFPFLEKDIEELGYSRVEYPEPADPAPAAAAEDASAGPRGEGPARAADHAAPPVEGASRPPIAAASPVGRAVRPADAVRPTSAAGAIDVGVVTRSFPHLTNAETAEFLAENGFRWVELCFKNADSDYWVYNGRSDLSELTDARSREIVAIYRNAGLQVPVLGVFTNLIDPNDAEREANLAYFERMMEIAAVNGIPTVATECGFRPGQRGTHAETFEADFTRLVESFRRLCRLGEKHGVDVALEPSVIDIVPSAKRARDFIRQVDSSRAKILLDPANLIANSTEKEMFEHLSPYIAYLHGKDRKVNDAKGRIVGDGEIDWPGFLSLYHQHASGKPFILEYVNRENVLMVRDRVLEADRARRMR